MSVSYRFVEKLSRLDSVVIEKKIKLPQLRVIEYWVMFVYFEVRCDSRERSIEVSIRYDERLLENKPKFTLFRKTSEKRTQSSCYAVSRFI